jgi:hypothetical protein
MGWPNVLVSLRCSYFARCCSVAQVEEVKTFGRTTGADVRTLAVPD